MFQTTNQKTLWIIAGDRSALPFMAMHQHFAARGLRLRNDVEGLPTDYLAFISKLVCFKKFLSIINCHPSIVYMSLYILSTSVILSIFYMIHIKSIIIHLILLTISYDPSIHPSIHQSISDPTAAARCDVPDPNPAFCSVGIRSWRWVARGGHVPSCSGAFTPFKYSFIVNKRSRYLIFLTIRSAQIQGWPMLTLKKIISFSDIDPPTWSSRSGNGSRDHWISPNSSVSGAGRSSVPWKPPNAEGGALHIGQGVKKSQQTYETDRYIHRWMDGWIDR